MTVEQARGGRVRRAVARIVKAIALIGVVLFLAGVVGVAALGVHFWDLQIGNPSSDTCVNCHVMEPYVASLTSNHLLASAHANEGLGCTDCHDYDAERQLHETIAYLTNDYVEPFPRARYEMETCFTCHDHASYAQLAWRTTDLGVSDGQAKGHDANPHQPPHYSELECHTCHRVHRESTLMCAECHAFQFQGSFFGIVPEATVEPTDDTADSETVATEESD